MQEGMVSKETYKYVSESKKALRDFPGGPVVKTSPSNTGGAGSVPGQGAKILHASRPKNQNRSNIVTN